MDNQEMVRVLINVHLLESKVSKMPYRRDSAQYVYEHFEGALFDSLGVDKSRYDRSLRYYVLKPKEFHKIYESVVDSLTVRSKNNNIY